MKNVIVGTAGHIDHGKTTLLKALTGIDTDRLAEEKRRGITIDLGFAHLELGGHRIGFVDVPGHERFVKNMLAGIGGIQFVLLVVAADESIMPQTVEHFQICRLLEIPDGMVVVTKAGLVEPELLDLVREEVADLVADSFLEGAPVEAVDSVSGEGVDRLKETLAARLDQGLRRPPAEDAVFRLPIDRVFSLKGFGTVVTGTPMTGRLRKDAAVAVYPRGKQGKVRGIQVFGHKEDEAVAGQRAALNLAGIDKADLERGMILAPPQTQEPTSALEATLTLLENAPAPLKHRGPVRFHHGSSEIMARVHLFKGKQLAPGETAVVQLRLAKPTVCCVGDHFILRRYSPMRTLGGGIVLDNHPPARGRRARAAAALQLEALNGARLQGEEQARKAFLRYFVERSGRFGCTFKELAFRTGLKENTLSEILATLPEIVTVPQDPPLALSRPALEALKEEIVQFLAGFQQERPLAPGASQEEVKKRFLDGSTTACFLFVLDQLRSEKRIETRSGVLRLHGSQVELSPQQEETRRRLLALFEDTVLQPPTFPQIVEKTGLSPAQVEEIFYYLLQTQVLIRISGDLVLSSRQVQWLEESVQKSFRKSESFGVSEFKDLLGVTRKYAIPLLEYLDRQRITRRVGDQRVVL